MIFSFTERVKEIIDVLKDLNQGVYKRTMVSSRIDFGDEAEVGKLLLLVDSFTGDLLRFLEAEKSQYCCGNAFHK